MAAILSALLANVWVQNGGWVVLLLGGITVGCTTVVFACAATSGHLVVKHAERSQRAIESGKQKELTGG